MPNFDGGHYFLTTLIPIRHGLCRDPRTDATVTSHLHELRATLQAMPTALQTPATEKTGLNSPFARTTSTHFARFAILDDVAFNGRGQRDPIAVAVGLAPKPEVTDPVDRLPCAYLIFVADFDAATGAETELDDYLRRLWQVMEPEWRAILMHCEGHEWLTDAAGFIRVMRACQVETTMPFNDYWAGAPALTPLPIKTLVAPILVTVAALAIGVLLWIFGVRFGMWLALAGLVGLPLALWWAFNKVNTTAAQALPTAPHSDLPSVLKALYLQQKFTRFATDMQGEDAATLHAAFGGFLAQHKPQDIAAPSQHPGVVKC